MCLKNLLICLALGMTKAHALDVEQLAADAQSKLQGRVPGGAISVLYQEQFKKIVFGRLGKNNPGPINESTVFRIASLSKGFTSELAALLVTEKKLSWDSLVKPDIPELKFCKQPNFKTINLKHLLSHQTGIVPYAFDSQLEQGTPLKVILAQMPKAPAICPPGTCYSYQNSLFSSAGLMLERRTGQSFSELLATKFFLPLGMQNTSVGFASDKHFNLAWPHIQDGRRWRQVSHSRSYYSAEPAAGINSSIDDLTTWLSAQLGYRQDVIPSAIIDQVTQPLVRSNKFSNAMNWKRLITGEYYGLGWRILNAGDEQVIFHSGGVRGYSAQISFSRKHQVGMVVIANAERNLDQITIDFWCDVLSSQREKIFCEN
jgi:beta-lactamase class C